MIRLYVRKQWVVLWLLQGSMEVMKDNVLYKEARSEHLDHMLIPVIGKIPITIVNYHIARVSMLCLAGYAHI